MKLENKVAIVTGSARAIGKEYALRLAQEGAKVTVCDVRDCDDTAKAIQSAGGDVLALKTDVSDESSTLEMARRTVEIFGRIDILVNNAAIYADVDRGPFSQISVEEWDNLMAVNLRGIFLCCRVVFPYMKEQGHGKIINISSTTAFGGNVGFIHYVTSKGGDIPFTRALAREVGEYNINVNAIAPGFTVTEFNAGNLSKESQETIVVRRSLKRQQQPKDLLETVVFLASEGSDFITGQVIVVDGGSIFH